MLRKFLATVLLVVALYAEKEDFQIIANNVDTKNNILVATGNVVIFSNTYYITAQKAIYDKNKGTFELFDDVVILRNNNVQTKSEYSFLDLNEDQVYEKPSMFYDEETAVWVKSSESEKKKKKIFLEDAVISSCDCIDPDWSIRVSDADYDSEDKWFNAYNPRLYFGDIPVLYSPYLGFSTDKRRRTGLLIPTIGYSGSSGAFYSQPIFIAPKENYDIELIPQYRSKRGKGMYAYFRYADSIDSIFKLSGGYFAEEKDYQEEHNLRNKEHYGIDVDYERYNLFTGKKIDRKDGLYVELNYLNDVEYRTLEDNSYKEEIEKKAESKINYVYSAPEYYFGSYFRYYIDTNKESNSNTLQELPKLQFHSYSRPLFFDSLLYSSDFKYTNHYRKDGLNANQYQLSVPFSYGVSLFDEFINFSVKQNFNINKYEYTNLDGFDDGTYIESNTTFTLGSDLIKPYENYIHTMNLKTDYIHSEDIEEEGDLYNVTNSDLNLSAFPISKSTDSIKLSLNQSFYDKENLKEIINHKLSQSILYDGFDDAKLQNMENEIIYNYILGSIKNRLVYNQQDKRLVESSSSFSLDYNNFYLKLGHYFARESVNAGFDEDLQSYQIDAKYKFSNRYSFGAYMDYNMEESIRTKLGYSFSINDSCWDLDLKYEKEVVPTSSNNFNDTVEQDILYVQLFLKPIGGIKQEIEISKEEQ